MVVKGLSDTRGNARHGGYRNLHIRYRYIIRGKKYSSDALFTPKMDIFKRTILNTAYIKTLEIFPSARE